MHRAETLIIKYLRVLGGSSSIEFILYLCLTAFIDHQCLNTLGTSQFTLAKRVCTYSLSMPLLLLWGLSNALLVFEDPVDDLGVIVGDFQNF